MSLESTFVKHLKILVKTLFLFVRLGRMISGI